MLGFLCENSTFFRAGVYLAFYKSDHWANQRTPTCSQTKSGGWGWVQLLLDTWCSGLTLSSVPQPGWATVHEYRMGVKVSPAQGL